MTANVLAFAASNSRRSINRLLIDYCAALVTEDPGLDAEVTVVGLSDFDAPMYSIDHENEYGIPPAAQALFTSIGAADALLISFAEHNGHYAAAYKSLFDWMTRIDRNVYQDKPAVMLATSPGRGGGRRALQAAVDSAPLYGADVLAHLAIPSFNHVFDHTTGRLTDADVDARLRMTLDAFSEKLEQFG